MIKSFFSSQLRINMISGGATTVFNIIIAAIMYPAYLYFLGYEKYGVWLILGTVLSFIQFGGNLGIEPAVTKLVAEEHGRKNIQGIQSYVTMAVAILTISGTVGLLITLFFKSCIISAFKLTGDNAVIASQLLPYVGLLCLYIFIVRVFTATLAGLGRMDLTNYIQLSSRIVTLVVAVILLYNGHGIESLLIGNIASYLLIHLSSLFFISRIVPLRFLHISNWDRKKLRELFQFGGGLFGGSILGMLISPFNKVMLSRYAGVETVPVYELTFQGASMLRSLFDSALRAMMPEISRLYGQATASAKERIKTLNFRIMKMIIFFAIPLYGIVMIIAEPLLKLWLRGRYIDTIPEVFRIMLVVTFLSLLAIPAYYTIMGFGKVRYFITAGIIGAGGNFVLVTIYYLMTGNVSVYSLGCCLIAVFAISTTYFIYKAQRLLVLSTELSVAG